MTDTPEASEGLAIEVLMKVVDERQWRLRVRYLSRDQSCRPLFHRLGLVIEKGGELAWVFSFLLLIAIIPEINFQRHRYNCQLRLTSYY
jgi:hypothetical protein